MNRHVVRLIHWNRDEGAERARTLASACLTVEFGDVTPELFASLREHPPAAVVIDLTRVPSAGRDVALTLRTSKATRRVPVVFVEGDPAKVSGIRKLLPDATYTTWSRIRTDLKRAIASPPAVPVVPASNLAGYSGTPLPKKLGIKPNAVVVLAGAPKGFESTLGELPDGVRLRRRSSGARDLTLWFVRRRRDLEAGIGRMARAGSSGMWIVWPKKTSAIAADFGERDVRAVGLASGLVDFKVCAVDGTWSGLKFVARRRRATT